MAMQATRHSMRLAMRMAGRVRGSAYTRSLRAGSALPSAIAFRPHIASVTQWTTPACAALPMQRRQMTTEELSVAQYSKLIEDTLETLLERFLTLEDTKEIEDFDCEVAHVTDVRVMQDGVLNLCLGEQGTYVLNKQAPNKQLWLASPISYNWSIEEAKWVNTKDGHCLMTLLTEEIKELVDIDLNLTAPAE